MEFIKQHFDNDQIFMNYTNESVIEMPEENESSECDSQDDNNVEKYIKDQRKSDHHRDKDQRKSDHHREKEKYKHDLKKFNSNDWSIYQDKLNDKYKSNNNIFNNSHCDMKINNNNGLK